MNVHLRAETPGTTQAAEGLPRRRWTVGEIEQLDELGMFGGVDREHERIELIGGEIVPMSAKGAWHENVKRALTRHWFKALPAELDAVTETTLRCGPHDFREPDFVFWPSTLALADLKPSDILLLVEVADSSLDYDLGAKATFYAGLGLPDYWVIDAKGLVIHVHRQPAGDRYSSIVAVPASSTAVPLHMPALAVCLSALGLSPANG